MDDVIIHATVDLKQQNTGQSRTRHYRGDEELPRPSALRIIQFADGSSIYLIYLDESGEEMTDTHHDSVSAAKDHALWELGVGIDAWTDHH